MTKAQAANLQKKWKQRGNPPPVCKHPIQELAQSGLNDEGQLLRTYLT